jgi:hypothetical protein
LSSQGVFLSYRREDAGPYARSLQLQLSQRIPDAHIFMDLDSIEAGLPFAAVIRDALESCTVLVALIGRQWMTITDEDGRRRLDDPDDYVRFEIQMALKRGVRVIPVLVDGARPLRQQELPSGLEKLAGLNALELSYGRYQYDADRLYDLIQRELAPIREREEAAREEAERKARRKAERKARQKAERKAREEAERLAREEEQLRDKVREQEATPDIGAVVIHKERAEPVLGRAPDVSPAREQLFRLSDREPTATSHPPTPGQVQSPE